MKSVRSLSSIFFAITWMFLGMGLFMIFSNVSLADAGVTSDKIGFINAGFYLGAVISAIAAQKWISKVGHIRCFAMFSAIVTIGMMMHTIVEDITILMILRFLMGFSYYANLMVIESWINEKSDHVSRAMVLGAYTMTFYLSFLIVSWLVGGEFVSKYYMTLCAIFVVFAIIPIMLTRIQQPSLPEKMPISLPKVFQVVPLALIGSLVAGICVGGFLTMSPVFVTNKGLDNLAASGFIGAAVLAGMLIQIPMGSFSVKIGRRIALMCSCIATIIGALLMLLPNTIPYAFNIASFIMGCGIFTLYSLSCARANDRIPEGSNVVEVGRSLLFCFCMGSFISPLILGFAMKYFSFYGFSVVYIISAAILFIVSFTQVNVPERFRKAYVNMPVSVSAGIETGVYENLQHEDTDTPTFTKEDEAILEENNTDDQQSEPSNTEDAPVESGDENQIEAPIENEPNNTTEDSENTEKIK